MNNEIILPSGELKSALAGLGKVVSKTHSLPIIQSVKISRDNTGKVSIQATDLDCFATVRLDQPQEGNQSTVVIPFKELVAVVKNTGSNDNIQIEQTSARQAVIRYNVGQTPMQQKVGCLDPKEWPEAIETKPNPVPVPNELREAVLQAMKCASRDSTRYVINGVFLDVTDRKANYVVGTDGRHLFAANSFSLPLKESIIIPNSKFLNWSGFSSGDGDWKLGVATVGAKEKRVEVQFESTHWTFTTKVVEGNYPNWKNVLPGKDDKATTMQFSPEAVELIQQVAPKMPGFDQVNETIGFKIHKNNVLLISRKDHKDSWTEVPLPNVTIVGKPATIHLNRTFLLQALEFGLTELQVEDSLSAMVFRSKGKQMVVMPVRCDDGSVAAKAQPTPTAQPNTPTPASTPEKQPIKTETRPTPTQTPTIERKEPMPRTSEAKTESNSNGTALHTATTQVEAIKDSLREAIRGLNDLLDTLKLAQKEQKTTDREIDSVRNTIKSLQKVQL